MFVLVFELFKGSQNNKISNLKAGVQTIEIKNKPHTVQKQRKHRHSRVCKCVCVCVFG